MMFDLCEMTMANGYFEDKERDRDDYVSFDVFYRNNPDGGGFAIFVGLEQVLDYLENLHFWGCQEFCVFRLTNRI